MRTKHNKNSGFTLVEVLVAIVVGGVYMSTFGVLLGAHTHLSQRGRDLTVANAFAENKIEEIRSKGYTAVGLGSTDISNELPAELGAPRSAELHVTTESDGLKQIVVSLAYNDQGKNQTYAYTTYLGELGVAQY
jgi:prepilin-type N-terminal cleavage/methylation domain-containing protein